MDHQQRKFKQYEIQMQVIIEDDERDHQKRVELFKEAMEIFGVSRKVTDAMLGYMNLLQYSLSETRRDLRELLHRQAARKLGEY